MPKIVKKKQIQKLLGMQPLLVNQWSCNDFRGRVANLKNEGMVHSFLKGNQIKRNTCMLMIQEHSYVLINCLGKRISNSFEPLFYQHSIFNSAYQLSMIIAARLFQYLFGSS